MQDLHHINATSYSSNEKNEKVFTYLRMNLPSKQIAQLENISVRGVEISRYRLRKKLLLPKETSLFNFLLEIDNNANGKPV